MFKLQRINFTRKLIQQMQYSKELFEFNYVPTKNITNYLLDKYLFVFINNIFYSKIIIVITSYYIK